MNDELVWKVCRKLMAYADDVPECKKCPHEEVIEPYGLCQRGCREAAEELIELVRGEAP